jgi:hypothetical protein
MSATDIGRVDATPVGVEHALRKPGSDANA